MPDNVKMSLNNAITIVGMIIACAVSYMGLSAKIEAQRSISDTHRERIEGLEDETKENHNLIYQLGLKVNDNQNKYNHIIDSVDRIEDFIKSYEYTESK